MIAAELTISSGDFGQLEPMVRAAEGEVAAAGVTHKPRVVLAMPGSGRPNRSSGFRLLGYQYSPRLADADGATFWRINPTDHGPLNGLARHHVNTRLIERHYDHLLRVAGSLLQRHTTASQLVRALRSHTRRLASLARALQQRAVGSASVLSALTGPAPLVLACPGPGRTGPTDRATTSDTRR